MHTLSAIELHSNRSGDNEHTHGDALDTILYVSISTHLGGCDSRLPQREIHTDRHAANWWNFNISKNVFVCAGARARRRERQKNKLLFSPN